MDVERDIKRWLHKPGNSKKAAIGAGVVGAVGLLWLVTRSGSASNSASASGSQPIGSAVRKMVGNSPPGTMGYARALGDPPENPYYTPPGGTSVAAQLAQLGHSVAPYKWRSMTTLPDDASAGFADRYSEHLGYSRPTTYLYSTSGSVIDQSTPPGYVDEYGRTVAGVSSNLDQVKKALAAGGAGFVDALANAKGLLKAVTDSPLWSIVQTGASFVPGIGTAVSVGMSVAYAYGHDISWKDAALSAARAAVPGGPAGQAGFDIAVALASGESASDAALSAARNQLPPGYAQMAFDQGVAVAKGKPVNQALKESAAQAASTELAKHGL